MSYIHTSREKIPSAWKSLETYACTESQNLSLNLKCQTVHPLADFIPFSFWAFDVHNGYG